MNKTKIDWADSTWNPVTGCLHGCEYCYARKIAERFKGGGYGKQMGMFIAPFKAGAFSPPYDLCDVHLAKTKDGWYRDAPYPFGFEPTFHRYRLIEPMQIKKPQNIFVCSMADLFGDWVPDEWIQEVFKACEAAPQHRYLFLTKNKERYLRLDEKDMLPRQHWYGYSATTEKDLWRFHHADECPVINLFVSIEPILSRLVPCFSTHCPADWVIIGAETGNRKDRVIPEREWVERIAMECQYSGRPTFMKSSLRELMGEDFIQEYPWSDPGKGHN